MSDKEMLSVLCELLHDLTEAAHAEDALNDPIVCEVRRRAAALNKAVAILGERNSERPIT